MKQSTLTKIYVSVMFTLFLFFTGFSGYTNIFTSKSVMFTALGMIYIALSVFCKMSTKSLGLPEIFALIYLGITALSAIVSDHFPKTLLGASRFEGLLTVGLYVLIFILVSESFEWDVRFAALLSAVMILQSAVVIIQFFDVNILSLYPKGENYHIALEKYNGAFISTVGNADIASAFFSLVTPILAVFAVGLKKYRCLTIPAALLSLLSTVLMDVSSGIFALAALVLVLPVVIFKEKRLPAAGIMLALVLTAGLLIYLLPPESGMLYELSEVMHGNLDSGFGSGRFHIWSEVISKLKPIFGTGPDTMIYEDIEPFFRYTDGSKITRKIDIAHNDYLNILFHQGVFALAAYLAMLVSLLVKWFKNGRDNIVITALGAGAFAYMIHTVFSFSACSSAVFFWIVMGALNGMEKAPTG